MSRLKNNLWYQTLFQVLNTCLPLITSPYLARVLGAEKQGVFSFTQSVVNYFTLFAMLGVVNYGTRAIAACKRDKASLSDLFWNIYSFQLVTSFTCLLFYILYLVFFSPEYLFISTIQGLYLIGSFLDANWLLFGLEKFKTTVTRNIVVRIVSVVAILTLVKAESDLWIYTLIMAGSPVLSNIIIWRFIPNEIDVHASRYIEFDKVKRHIKPNLILFVPLFAMSVFHIMDKTMLGLLSTYEQVGYYYNADKIINIPIGIINGVGTVMLPRMTTLFAENREEEIREYFSATIEGIVLCSSAMAFGISAIASEFTPLFFGEGFDSCILLIIVLSPVLVIKGLSQTARMQFLIPANKERIFIESVSIGAIVNLIVNYLLIPQMGAMGAVIGTVIAEGISCIWQFMKMNRHINAIHAIVRSSCYIIIGFIMLFLVRGSVGFIPGGFLGVILEIAIGAIIYSALCLLFMKITKNHLLILFLRKP